MITDRDIRFDVVPADADAIEGAALLTDIADAIRSYVVMTIHQVIALALWVVHTHALDASTCTPYIAIRSAAKRSGKTTLLEVLALLVARPWLTGRVSAAVLVRKTDKERPTLCLDESDAMFGGEKEYSEALRGILNTGFKSTGKTSLCIGQGANITYKDFRTFGAKAIAGIGNLPDTVTDRSIVITLKRRARGETVERFRERIARADLDPLRNTAAAWAVAHLSTLRGREPRLPDALNDRAQDVWEPLLAIADEAGGDWPTLARKAALALSVESKDDEDISVQLLTDCRTVFDEADNPETMSSKAVVEALIAIEDRPWSSWSGGRPITQAKIARMLGGFGIHPFKVRSGAKVANSYSLRAFEDAFSRYLPLKAEQQNKPNEYGPESAFLKVEHGTDCSTLKMQVSPMNTGLSSAVPVSTPETGTREQEDGGADDGSF